MNEWMHMSDESIRTICEDNSRIHGKCRQRFYQTITNVLLFFPTFWRFFNCYLNVYYIYETNGPGVVCLRRCWRRFQDHPQQPRSDWLTLRSGQRSCWHSRPVCHSLQRHHAITPYQHYVNHNHSDKKPGYRSETRASASRYRRILSGIWLF